MKNLIVIDHDGIIRGIIARVDLPQRQTHLAANKAQQTTEHESAPGAGDVTFELVTEPDQATFEQRELEVGYAWDLDSGRGIDDQATLTSRERATADAQNKDGARAALTQLREIANGPPSQIRVVARVVLFLAVRALR